MHQNLKIIKSIVATFVVAMLFSCEGNLQDVKRMYLPGENPQGVGKNINLKYTDSGRVVAALKSEELLDYSNKEFPYREFPKGVEVEFFNEQNEKSTVHANYAIIYEETSLIDLQGDVVIVTSVGTHLNAEQIYWDQEQNWIFTDKPNTIKFKNGAVNKGQGFDASQDFTTFISRSNTGVQIIEEKEE